MAWSSWRTSVAQIGIALLAACANDVGQGRTPAATGDTGIAGDDDDAGTISPTTAVDDGDGEGDDTSGGGSNATTSTGPGDDTTGSPPIDGSSSDTSDDGPVPDCMIDTDCPLGQICDNAICVDGCSGIQQCPGDLTCCGGTCVNTDDDLAHCGDCDFACDEPPNIAAVCEGGRCGLGDCDAGFFDCDGSGATGCEQAQACACTPGAVQACYPGPAGTQGVGACTAGTQTCNAAGTAWGACVNYVTPTLEICANNIDEDCNGVADDIPDFDGDGWTSCQNDCCESAFQCSDPSLVNPGAFEFGGNNLDDDCDGVIDNVVPGCDAGLASNSANADDYARAIDLCQFTQEFPANPANLAWGVVQAQLLRANAAGVPAANSRAIRDGFGSVGANPNQLGSRMAVLSSGRAADNAGDVNPAFATFQDGQNMGTSSAFPADWLALNGGTLPNAAGCPVAAGNLANDPVMLRLRVRVPTNAQSFTVSLNFFSAEYPEYVCTVFNDFFVALIDSTAANNPADKNIAIYSNGVNQWPLGVNILQAAPGLFTQCSNGAIGQCGTGGNYNGCITTNGLNGTGFDIMGATGFSCGYNGRHGGGTGWLSVSGNVTPGEIMTIRFAIWDTGDALFDSLVLLDNWQWNVNPSQPGIVPQ